MTKKLWFQLGVGLFLALLIIDKLLDLRGIFYPIAVILSAIFVPLLAGGILFYITEPLQRLLEKRAKFPRWASILSIIVLILAVIYGFGAYIGPILSEQFTNIIKMMPSMAQDISDGIKYILNNREHFPAQVKDAINNAIDGLQDYAVLTSKFIVDVISTIVSWAFLLILIPFFYIYMMKDHERFAPMIYNLFEGQKRDWVKGLIADVNDVLKNYIQGQMLISFLLAVIMFIGYKIIGLDYALLLVMFAFCMNIIPFVGPWLAFVPALIVGFLQDPILAIWVSVVTLVAQQIDSNFITPNVMGKTLEIHPLTVITIILTAGNLLGFVGILLGVPLYAVAKVIVKNIYNQRKVIHEAATKDV